MVRNKSQGQDGLNENRQENEGDLKQGTKLPSRGIDEDQREGSKKTGKSGLGRKGGNFGKTK
jgi:hypothetical protein